MISVNAPSLGRKELNLISECIKTGWISHEGPFVKKFEDAFAQFCNAKYGVACSSGTAALHLGFISLGINKNDEVIIPTFTMIATAYALIYIGAKPVLVDAEPRTWNMDVGQIEDKLGKRTKAILPVHIYGHPVKMDTVWQIARSTKILIFSDSSEAHGAEFKGIKAGALCDAAAFSFYANKIVTTGEGGMVVTNRKRVAERARYFRNMAFQKKTRYLHKDVGYNYRMTNLQAAIGLAQTQRIEESISKKRKIAHLYDGRLKGIEGITTPIEESWAKNVYWVYGILIDEKILGLSRDKFREELYKEGIDTRPFFIPMHKQPVFRKMGLFLREKYPVSEDIAKRGLCLPSGLNLNEKQIDFICEKIKKIKQKYG